MSSVPRLGELLGCDALLAYADPRTWFTHRDDIKSLLAEHLRSNTTAHWLGILEPSDVWCADVFTWPQLLQHDAFKVLRMTQRVSRPNGAAFTTTRCPIRVDGEILTSEMGSPNVGAHNSQIVREFNL